MSGRRLPAAGVEGQGRCDPGNWLFVGNIRNGDQVKKFIDESWLVLVMGVVFATLLAGTQTSLQARIDENKTRALNEAIAAVVPGTQTTDELIVDGNQVYKCLGTDGTLVGWAVDASGTGFVDQIRAVVGLSPDGSQVIGVKVIECVETPGLGNKIEGEWADQFAGRPVDQVTVVKGDASAERNEIQAITGATYSSQYVADILNDVTQRIRPKLGEVDSSDAGDSEPEGAAIDG